MFLQNDLHGKNIHQCNSSGISKPPTRFIHSNIVLRNHSYDKYLSALTLPINGHQLIELAPKPSNSIISESRNASHFPSFSRSHNKPYNRPFNLFL